MKLNTLLVLAVSFIPALAQDSEWSFDYEESSLDEGMEDNLLGGLFDTLGAMANDAISVLKNIESEEKATKSAPNSIKVKTPDVNEVKRHWGHASFAYCIKDQKPFHMCNVGECKGYNVTKTFENSNLKTLVIVGVDVAKKEVIVSHRGTSSKTNWNSNKDVILTEMENHNPKHKVHTGFYKVYKSNEVAVNKYIFELLKLPSYKGFKVVFTGHSLGGAVSTIHAARLATSLKASGTQVELFAYHSPRVGGKDFAQYVSGLDMTIARYTNKNDPFSRVPGRFAFYSHILGEFHYPSKGGPVIKCDTKFDEDPNCGVGEAFKFNIDDHKYAFDIKKSVYCGK